VWFLWSLFLFVHRKVFILSRMGRAVRENWVHQERLRVVSSAAILDTRQEGWWDEVGHIRIRKFTDVAFPNL
jgi:hypothetical protein